MNRIAEQKIDVWISDDREIVKVPIVINDKLSLADAQKHIDDIYTVMNEVRREFMAHMLSIFESEEKIALYKKAATEAKARREEREALDKERREHPGRFDYWGRKKETTT